MSSILAWVLGRGGFLGSRVVRALPREFPGITVWNPGPDPIPWTDPIRLDGYFSLQASRFSEAVRSGGGAWSLLWCAGRGVVSTPAPELEAEARSFAGLLHHVGVHLADPAATVPGSVLLSSSAGGAWGDSPEQPLTEGTPGRPLSDYGRNKLRQEEILREWAAARPHVRFMIARISNLYGPGQDLSKPQGLISHLCRSLLYHLPVHIYTPLDTLRDYFHGDDCARHLARCLARLHTEAPSTGILKIFAAGRSHSIAAIVGILTRIVRRHPRIITAAIAARRQQPRNLVFRSTVWPETTAPTSMDLTVGIHAVYADQLALFQQGRLPAPERR